MSSLSYKARESEMEGKRQRGRERGTDNRKMGTWGWEMSEGVEQGEWGRCREN